jgi:arsenate reductase
MKTLKIYHYPKCDTCRKAFKFLDGKKVSYEAVEITSHPPTLSELKKMLALVGDRKKLFNTSGVVYKEMKLAEKLPALSDSEALDLLAKNGKLVKRPFVLTDQTGLVGFREEEWKKVFS